MYPCAYAVDVFFLCPEHHFTFNILHITVRSLGKIPFNATTIFKNTYTPLYHVP